MRPQENPDFLRKDKIVISVKIQNFSRSQMTKRTSPLESFREIKLPRRISLNSETVGISRFSRHREGCRGHLARFGWPRGDTCPVQMQSNIELKWGSHVTHGMMPLEGNLIMVG